jgi:LacI family transcriptional regulator
MPPISRHNETVVRALTEELQPKGYQLLFAPAGGPVEDWSHLLLDRILDACVVVDFLPKKLPEVLKATETPAVFVNLRTDIPAPHIVVDDRDGAVQLTRHLLDLGHRRIAYYDAPDTWPHPSVAERQAGYLQAMRDAGLENMCRVMCLPMAQMPEEIKAMREPPTAIIAYHQVLAIRLVRLLWQAGLRVPQDISMATFNDAFPSEDVIPSLTTVRLPVAEMGKMAADLLVQQIESAEAASPQMIVLPVKQVVVRESTARPGAILGN